MPGSLLWGFVGVEMEGRLVGFLRCGNLDSAILIGWA